MRPGLTVVCFTKDQAPKLLRMLQSVQGVADEVVVVDTGSKDLSPGVAKTQGARVIQIEWPGSFAEAMNVAIQEVSTEWTLRIDTDEWLRPDSGPQIRMLLDNPDAFGYELLRQDLFDETHFSESWHFRLWRSHPQLRMEGFIHEHFPDELLIQLAGKRRILQAPIGFLHDGFIGGNLQHKQRRNIEYLRKELEARPGQEYYEVELVMTMLLLNEAGAIEMLGELTDRFLAIPPQPRPGAFVANLLGTALTHTKDAELESTRTREIVARSYAWFGACPPMLWAIVQIERRRKNHQGMLRALLKLEELGQTEAYEREWAFDIRMIREGLWAFLAEVAGALGEREIAERNQRRLG